jgi:hypothetical protein
MIDGILYNWYKIMSRIRADEGPVGREVEVPAGKVLVREGVSEIELPIGREIAREVGLLTVGDTIYEVTGVTII